MNRIVVALLIVLLSSLPAAAGDILLGAGAYGGVEIPIVQDDQSQGTVFGIKGRLRLFQPLTFEPNINFTSYGSPDLEDVISDPEGADITSIGLDVVLGSGIGSKGFTMFAFAGIAQYGITIDQLEYDEDNLGYSGGLGFELGFSPMISMEGRGRFIIIPTEGDGSRKAAAITVGLNISFGS